jgi:hypothetical protein
LKLEFASSIVLYVGVCDVKEDEERYERLKRKSAKLK